MERVLLACSCGARLDATKARPGAKVRCPKCGASLLVPAAPAPADPKPAAAPAAASEPAASPVRRRPSFEKRPAKKPPIVPLAAAGGALLLGAAFFLLRDGGGSTGGGTASPPAPTLAGGTGKPGAAVAPSSVAPPESRPAPDPKVAKKAEFAKRLGAAKASGEAPALLAAAKFAEEAGLAGDALPVYEAILAIDSDQPEARAALGFAKYEGPAEEFRGKWLTAAQLAKAKDAEAAIRAEEERWSKDEFMKAAASMRTSMEAFAGEYAFRFFADTVTVARPYLIAAQESAVHPPAELAREVGRVLEALYAKFYAEYGEPCGIRPIEVPVPVWVFTDKDTYEKAHEKRPRLAPSSSKGIGGYYLGALPVLVESGEARDLRTSGFLYLWNDEDLEGVALHEGTHQLIGFSGKSRFFGGGQSPWFQEGVAEYWAGYRKSVDAKTGKFSFDIGHVTRRLVDQRWKLARTAFESEAPPQGEGGEEGAEAASQPSGVSRFTLRGLLDFGYADFEKVKASAQSEKPDPKDELKLGLVYAQGWALCHFLNQALEGKYRRGFHRYVRAELDGEGGPEVFARCFGLKSDEDWSALEKEWKTYVLEDLRKQARALSR